MKTYTFVVDLAEWWVPWGPHLQLLFEVEASYETGFFNLWLFSG